MKFYKYLYIGDTVKDPSKVKWKLKHHAGVQAFIINTALGDDQLEIMHSSFLKQKFFRKHPPIVVGIAESYEDAVQIIIDITKESLERTGNCNLKEYLKLKAKQKNIF